MNSSMFEIIYDVNSLDGTNYVEIFPNVFENKFWNASSIYLTEESFEYLVPAFQRCSEDFDLYGFNNIEIATWQLIIQELEKLKQALINNFQSDSTSVFMADQEMNTQELISLISELVNWIEKQSQSTNCISVLGL